MEKPGKLQMLVLLIKLLLPGAEEHIGWLLTQLHLKLEQIGWLLTQLCSKVDWLFINPITIVLMVIGWLLTRSKLWKFKQIGWLLTQLCLKFDLKWCEWWKSQLNSVDKNVNKLMFTQA